MADPVSVIDPAELDRADPLARFRGEFHLPPGRIYLDGNSLGLLSNRAEASLTRVLDEWRTLGIDGWTEGKLPWLTLSEEAAAGVAPLVGAAREQVAVTGQTTANLHQLLATLYDPGQPRRGILGDALNFASDTYALESHLRIRGLDPAHSLRLVPTRDGRTLRMEDIFAALGSGVQMAVFSSVLFTSGQLLDLAAITQAAHRQGVLIGFDCSHSIGVVPHALDRDGVDFAFWSHYKWLNAGPGAVGGLYLNRRHCWRDPGLAGWWGVRAERRFAMNRRHERSEGAAALQIGTPHLLSLAPLLGSVEMFSAAGGIEPMREKSLRQTQWLMEWADCHLTEFGFAVVNPRKPQERGGHVALAHREAWRICQAWKAAGVVPDFRPPDVIRLAPAPLYTSYAECAEAVSRLREIMVAGTYREFPAQPALVT